MDAVERVERIVRKHQSGEQIVAADMLMADDLRTLLSLARSNGWQDIEGWNGRYAVSPLGVVRRSDGFVLKQWPDKFGYMLVRLSQPRTVERVHRLVAKAFCPNPGNKPFVNHLNNKRDDNRAENLEWCTQWENLDHAQRQGRMRRDNGKGKRSPNAALTDEEAAAIRETYAAGGISMVELGKRYGVGKHAVGRIISGATYAEVR